jgi:predicted RNase H-like HicB family nuclease
MGLSHPIKEFRRLQMRQVRRMDDPRPRVAPPWYDESMLTRYIHEAMRRAHYKTLENGAFLGQIPGLAGVWASEGTLEECRRVLQEVLKEWLVLKIRDNDPIPRIGRVSLPLRAA